MFNCADNNIFSLYSKYKSLRSCITINIMKFTPSHMCTFWEIIYTLQRPPGQHNDILVLWQGHIALSQWCHPLITWSKAEEIFQIPFFISSVYPWLLQIISKQIFFFLILTVKAGLLLSGPSLTLSHVLSFIVSVW